jgi:hypothetical protein
MFEWAESFYLPELPLDGRQPRLALGEYEGTPRIDIGRRVDAYLSREGDPEFACQPLVSEAIRSFVAVWGPFSADKLDTRIPLGDVIRRARQITATRQLVELRSRKRPIPLALRREIWTSSPRGVPAAWGSMRLTESGTFPDDEPDLDIETHWPADKRRATADRRQRQKRVGAARLRAIASEDDDLLNTCLREMLDTGGAVVESVWGVAGTDPDLVMRPGSCLGAVALLLAHPRLQGCLGCGKTDRLQRPGQRWCDRTRCKKAHDAARQRASRSSKRSSAAVTRPRTTQKPHGGADSAFPS